MCLFPSWIKLFTQCYFVKIDDIGFITPNHYGIFSDDEANTMAASLRLVILDRWVLQCVMIVLYIYVTTLPQYAQWTVSVKVTIGQAICSQRSFRLSSSMVLFLDQKDVTCSSSLHFGWGISSTSPSVSTKRPHCICYSLQN